jgi:hypothetical protein
MSFSEIEAFFKSFILKNNILARITEIENWRKEEADPKIETNLFNIEKFAKVAQDASSTSLLASNNALSASNIAVEAKNTVESILTRVEIAETNAINAATQSNQLFGEIQSFSNRLIATGQQLQTDLDELMVAEASLRTVLTQELDGIRRQYNDFADAIKVAGESVKKEGEDVNSELIEIVTEMNKPMQDIQEYLRRLQRDSPIFIPFNAAMTVSLIVSSSAVIFTQGIGGNENPALIAHYIQPGNGTIVEEMIEGFKEVGKEFLDIAASLGNFSNTLETESRKLGDRLILANNLINAEFKKFIDTFQKIFFNLSFNLRGETLPGV